MQGGDSVGEKSLSSEASDKRNNNKQVRIELKKTDEYKLGKLTQAAVMNIFSFMTVMELINKVSKINKKIRKWLVKPAL